jgi:DNA repair protein RadC
MFGLEPAAADAMELRVVHDHIIVGKNGHASLKGMKLI